MQLEQIQKLVESIGPAVIVVVALVVVAIGLGIAIMICLFLSSCLTKLPEEHRKVNPGMVWLLMIPCFSIVWNFFMYPKIAESFESYFASIGRTDLGDCSRSLAMWYCILTAVSLPLSLIPILSLLNCILGPATLVIWIVVLVKFSGLKGQIAQA